LQYHQTSIPGQITDIFTDYLINCEIVNANFSASGSLSIPHDFRISEETNGY
jgi:hypothetical protein